MPSHKRTLVYKPGGLVAGIAALLLVLALLACSGTPTSAPVPTPTRITAPYDVERVKAYAAESRELWEAQRADYYEITYVSRSFPSGVKITVRDGQIIEMGRDHSHILTEKQRELIPTVEELFEEIEARISLVSKPRITFHHQYGYPVEFYIYYASDDREVVVMNGWSNAYFKDYQPLEPAPASGAEPTSLHHAMPVTHATGGPVPTVEELLERGLRLAGASPVHLTLRGTAAATSARCDWRGIARTPDQRTAAIRYWLGLSATATLPDADYLEALFAAMIGALQPEYAESAYANFRAIAHGGLNTEYLYLACYLDYAASEYLIGSGPLAPSTLAVAYDRRDEASGYALYRREH